MAGVLAIAIHSIGALGKQYAEMVENIDMKPVEGAALDRRELDRLHALCGAAAGRRPALPATRCCASRSMCASASVMGFVGAGGIGQELIVAIRKFYYSDVSAILLMIIVTVFVIDIGTGWVRGRLFGKERARMSQRCDAGHRSACARDIRMSSTGRRPRGWRGRRCCSRRSAIFVFGLVHLDFSPVRMLERACTSSAGSSMMMMPPESRLVAAALSRRRWAKRCRSRCSAPRWRRCSRCRSACWRRRNIVPSNIFRFPIRRFLDTIRGVDTLIWALVWINVVGLGPFAGVLAIAVSDFGAFGKLFSEAIEGADKKQVEGIRASGGNALHEIRFGLMPQVLPVIAGQVLYFIESNTRSATIIGIVGAGGIGLQLAEQIRVLEWQKVSFLILMILIAVAAIDWISSKLRFAIIGPRAVRRRLSQSSAILHHELDALGRKARALGQQRLAVGIDVGAVDHQHRTAQRQVEPRRVGGVDDGGGDPGRSRGDNRGCRNAPAAWSSSACCS